MSKGRCKVDKWLIGVKTNVRAHGQSDTLIKCDYIELEHGDFKQLLLNIKSTMRGLYIYGWEIHSLVCMDSGQRVLFDYINQVIVGDQDFFFLP